MAYDEALAARIRELIGNEPGLSEMKMFGGLAFLVNGNMAVSASGRGGLMLRVDPAESADLVAGSPARVIEMRGRPMPGWLFVETDQLGTKKALSEWVARGVSYARSLPPKSKS
jgi:TfoX N-terminal domain